MTFSKTYFCHKPIWEETHTIPFNELILSWNGIRPKRAKWTFWVSLQKEEWLKYAEWGPDSQRSFKSKAAFAENDRDVVIPREVCTAFQVRVEGEELCQLHTLYACVSHLAHHTVILPEDLPPVFLQEIPRQSQMVLDHPRHKDLCSPTSTTTAMKIVAKRSFDPIDFASRIYDDAFDIYGNWILNIAEAYHQLRSPCHVERLADFSALHAQLMQGRPVVVSVKGEIPGAPKPYSVGHLLCVVGYERKTVYCIDSGFPDNASTFVGYGLKDFLTAWGIRRNLAYVFPGGI